MAALVGACGSRGRSGSRGSDGPRFDSSEADIARGRELVLAAMLPERPVVLALAESIEARAEREGGGARAIDLHVLAARLLERVWRVDGREQDAKEALDLYRSAAKEPLAGACEAAVAGALLAGEAAHDATTTGAELYRVQRRFAALSSVADGGPVLEGGLFTPCLRRVERTLQRLSPFTPPADVREAIDQGLMGQGLLAGPPGEDAGAHVVRLAAQIVRIEQWPGRDNARVVVVLDRPAQFRAGDEMDGVLNRPRVFVDLDGVDVGGVPRDLDLQGIVTHLRSEPTTAGARIALDLDGRAFRRVFPLPEPYRVVIDVARHPESERAGVEMRGRRLVERVVLDPGHGGRDTGAVGPSGLKEKDVTLDIAHRAAPVLAREGIQVVMTRDEDRAVPLEERTARANAFNADLFVSIHCNASESRARHGVETYVLDTTRDEIADRVAARENATSAAANAELGSILSNMRLADQASRSTKLAELLQRATMASLRMRFPDASDGGVHTAGFYVLVGARMPGVLFETSYISNVTEEQRLSTEDYRQALADAIVNAVRAYREGR